MALADDLQDYMALHGTATTDVGTWAGPVIVGETHQFMKGDAPIRSVASVRLLRELLKDLRFRYFANESFLNAGSGRRALRDYWQSGTLPPAFDNSDPAQAALVGEDLARRVLTRRFQAGARRSQDPSALHPAHRFALGRSRPRPPAGPAFPRGSARPRHRLRDARRRAAGRRPRGGDPVRRQPGERRA